MKLMSVNSLKPYLDRLEAVKNISQNQPTPHDMQVFTKFADETWRLAKKKHFDDGVGELPSSALHKRCAEFIVRNSQTTGGTYWRFHNRKASQMKEQLESLQGQLKNTCLANERNPQKFSRAQKLFHGVANALTPYIDRLASNTKDVSKYPGKGRQKMTKGLVEELIA